MAIENRRRLPDWSLHERQSDLAWIGENLEVFVLASSVAYQEIGRSAIIVDTISQPVPGDGHPFSYVEQEEIEQDGDPLFYNLQYSPDNGASWLIVDQNISETTVSVDTNNLVAGAQALFRVWATDGLHTARDQSDSPFSLPNRVPQVKIEAPEPNITVATDQTLSLDATVYDPDLGSMDGDQVKWSSDLDGNLGTGSQLSITGLSVGTHRITVQADDGAGGVSSDWVQVIVVADTSQLPDLPNGLLAGPSQIFFVPEEGLTSGRISVDNQNLFVSIRWMASISQPWVKLSALSGTTPYDDIYATFEDNGLKGGMHSAAITLTSPDVPGQEIILNVVVIVSDNSIYLPALWR